MLGSAKCFSARICRRQPTLGRRPKKQRFCLSLMMIILSALMFDFALIFAVLLFELFIDRNYDKMLNYAFVVLHVHSRAFR